LFFAPTARPLHAMPPQAQLARTAGAADNYVVLRDNGI